MFRASIIVDRFDQDHLRGRFAQCCRSSSSRINLLADQDDGIAFARELDRFQVPPLVTSGQVASMMAELAFLTLPANLGCKLHAR